MPTALIADDERLMRDQLQLRLQQTWPELEIVAQAKNGEEAISMVQQHQPDFAFLDIKMPGITGLEAAQAISHLTHIVFITAYDQYAVEAFEYGAIDYVLKPADITRLKVTVGRLKMRLTQPPKELSHLISQLHNQLTQKPTYLQWIQATIGSELRFFPVQDILFFQSDEKYTRAQTHSVEALIRKPVRELVEELDPNLFWQIHRSTIINVNAIEGITRDMRGRLCVHIKGTKETLEVSRSYVHLFKQM